MHATAQGTAAPPALADGVELLGAMQGSGYRQVPGLVRRADGQTIQLTPLLYALLSAVDGARGIADVADVVSRQAGRRLQPQDAEQLLETKLRPLGVLRGADGGQPEVHKVDPLLGLRFRIAVTDPTTTRRLTAPFAVLFRPLVAAVVIAAFVLTAAWLLFVKGLGSATADAFDTPALLLLIVVFTVLSAGFHEFGHAAACRYGGATPGAMGAGLYLVWPAFYTEVNDSYRLGRAGRLRVDLGGLYFNALFAVATVGVWALTRSDALLLLVVAQVLQMLRQLTPLVRFDGYHVLADLTGVPDLYSRIGPTLRGLLPWNWGRAETRLLRPWARAVVSAWVLVVVPVLLFTIGITVVAFPRVVGTALTRLRTDVGVMGTAWEHGDVSRGFVALFAMVVVALPVLGGFFVLGRLLRRLSTLAWRRTRGRPVARALVVAAAAVAVVALAVAWWPRPGAYRPVTRQDRGTLGDVVHGRVWAGDRTATRLSAGTVVRGRTAVLVAPPGLATPTQSAPVPAVVLVPRDGRGTTWVFPFPPPSAPGAGDNQAYALNRTDGSTVYDVSFALVWLDGDTAASRNEAYALANCSACTTVAVAFQVVLVAGPTRLAIPQNVAAAVNVGCVECLTYAAATQLVLQLPPDGLTAEARQQLEQLWTQATTDVGGLSLDQLQARIRDISAQVKAVVGTPSPSPTPSSTAAVSTPSAVPYSRASSSASPQPSRSSGSTPTPTGSSTRSATPSATPSPPDAATSTAEPTPSPS